MAFSHVSDRRRLPFSKLRRNYISRKKYVLSCTPILLSLIASLKTLDLVKKPPIWTSASRREQDWVDRMYMKGVFKIVCTGFRRIGLNERLSRALTPVPIPTPGQSMHKRKVPPTPRSSKGKRAKRERD